MTAEHEYISRRAIVMNAVSFSCFLDSFQAASIAKKWRRKKLDPRARMSQSVAAWTKVKVGKAWAKRYVISFIFNNVPQWNPPWPISSMLLIVFAYSSFLFVIV